MTNQANRVLYTGMTNDLRRRVMEHRSGEGGAFTRRYKAGKLVYYEVFEQVMDAVGREKQIKAGTRQRKVKLIEAANPNWDDLYESL